MQSSIKFFTNQRPDSSAGSGNEADATAMTPYNRGIIQINIPPFTDTLHPQSRQKIRVIMYGSIDCSGSMAENASHCQSRQNQHQNPQQQQNTKMHFVHATLNNMVETIISQQEEFSHVEFYLALVQFHSSATCVLHPMRVTPESKDAILQVISQIRPLNGTNFEKCFKEMTHLISNEAQHISPSADIPEHCTQRMHIFLTDGDNNEGNKSIPHLASLLGATTAATTSVLMATQPATHPATQIMIGYGIDHDSATLQSLCSHFPNSRQWFIDDIEKTGCIFGEILWSSVNAAFTKVSIKTPNAEVYDFETMQWRSEICLGDFAYDSSRTYYVRAPWQNDEMVCNFTYTSIEAPQDTSCDIITPMNYTSSSPSSVESPETKDREVEKELWRLDTIATIDKSIQFFKAMRRMTMHDQAAEKSRLIDEITAFQEKFLKYATDNNLLDDPYIVQLADDLFVCINGLAVSIIGERYIAARQASQIQQRAVTINDITPLQREIIVSMPVADDEVVSVTRRATSARTRMPASDDFNCFSGGDDNVPTISAQMCTPVSRARSAYVGGCVDDDTQAPPAAAPTSTPMSEQEPKTPRPSDTPADDGVLSQTQEKLLSDLTPSSRGVGSNLRIMTRDAMIGMRNTKVRGYANYHCGGDGDGDDGEYYGSAGGGGGGAGGDFMDSCGGDDTFSSHASPGCARIGRMLSAPSQPRNPVTRTATTPF